MTLDDEHKKAPVASPRDTPINDGERATSANTGAADFVRRSLRRVNSDDLSKTVDAVSNFMPVHHGATEEFYTFDPNRSCSTAAHVIANLGTGSSSTAGQGPVLRRERQPRRGGGGAHRNILKPWWHLQICCR